MESEFELIDDLPSTGITTPINKNQTTGGRFAERIWHGTKGFPGDIAQSLANASNPQIVATGEPASITNELASFQQSLGKPLGTQLLEALSGQLPTSQELNKNQAPAETFAQKALDYVADGLGPWAIMEALTGGAGIGAKGAKEAAKAVGSYIGRSVTGQAGASAAEELGLGDIGQLLGRMSGEVGFDIAKNAGKPFRWHMEDAMNRNYEEANAESKILTFSAKNLEKEIHRKIDEVNAKSIHGLDVPASGRVVKELKSLDNKIQQGKINVFDAVDKKKHFNKLAKNAPTIEEKRFLLGISKNLNDQVIFPAAKKNPLFGKPYLRGEELYKALEVPSSVRWALESLTDYSDIGEATKDLLKSKTAQSIILSIVGTGTGAVAGGLPTAAAVVPGLFGARTVLRGYDLLTKSPFARKALGQLVEASFEPQKKLFFQKLKTFDKISEKHDKKLSKEEEFELIN